MSLRTPAATAPTGTVLIRALAAAKINLFLRVGSVDDNGYHALDSVLVPVGLFDELVFTVRRVGPGQGALDVRANTTEGWQWDHGADRPDLVARAAQTFLNAVGDPERSTSIRVDLCKHIPLGAGLGGGSSDAAATLLALNHVWGGPLSGSALMNLALTLGADVPFCLSAMPARVGGIGELVSPRSMRPGMNLVVCWPGQAISTAAVFAEFDRTLTKKTATSIRSEDGLARTRIDFVNDLEEAAGRIFAPILQVKARLRELGARDAAMSGSGSAVFGTFDMASTARAAAAVLQAEGLWAESVQTVSRGLRIERIDGR